MKVIITIEDLETGTGFNMSFDPAVEDGNHEESVACYLGMVAFDAIEAEVSKHG